MAKRIAVLGAGNMGMALVKGILQSSWGKDVEVTASDPRHTRLQELTKDLKVRWTDSNREAAKRGDIVILAVKPQIIDDVIRDVRGVVSRAKLVISIAAGVSTQRIERGFGKPVPVIRAMPNVATLVKLGATAITPGKHATAKHVEAAQRIFEAVGLAVVLDEYHLDAVTGLSGSGPMYIFQIIEGLSDAGVRVGLNREVSTKLSIQTVLGAAKMAQELNQHPAVLKELVTSPGGTAIAALHSLEQNGLRAVLMDAVMAATERSRELGRQAEAVHQAGARKR